MVVVSRVMSKSFPLCSSFHTAREVECHSSSFYHAIGILVKVQWTLGESYLSTKYELILKLMLCHVMLCRLALVHLFTCLLVQVMLKHFMSQYFDYLWILYYLKLSDLTKERVTNQLRTSMHCHMCHRHSKSYSLLSSLWKSYKCLAFIGNLIFPCVSILRPHVFCFTYNIIS